jgi:hypothetical protein
MTASSAVGGDATVRNPEIHFGPFEVTKQVSELFSILQIQSHSVFFFLSFSFNALRVARRRTEP